MVQTCAWIVEVRIRSPDIQVCFQIVTAVTKLDTLGYAGLVALEKGIWQGGRKHLAMRAGHFSDKESFVGEFGDRVDSQHAELVHRITIIDHNGTDFEAVSYFQLCIGAGYPKLFAPLINFISNTN